MGITWGLTASPESQRWSTRLCTGFGLVMAVVGLSALWGMGNMDVDAARAVEDNMYNARIASEELVPDDDKRVPASPEKGEKLEARAPPTNGESR